MYKSRRLDLNPLALAANAVGTYNSAQIPTSRGGWDDSVMGSIPTFTEYSGPMNYLRGVLMISNANGGTANLIVQGLVPGQDGTQAYHWRTLGSTAVQNAAGAFDVQITGPVPAVIRLQLVIATATVTCGGWVELGD